MKKNNLIQIYKGCAASFSAFSDIMSNVVDSSFKQVLNEMRGDYQEVSEIVLYELKDANIKVHELPLYLKISMWIQIQLKLFINDSEKTVATMIIKGCNMGSRKMEKLLKKEKNEVYKNILRDFIDLQYDHIRKMEEYL